MVTGEIGPGSGYESRQLSQKLQRFEDEMCGAVLEGVFAVVLAAYVAMVLVYLVFPGGMQVTIGRVPLSLIVHALFIAGVFAIMANQAPPSANDTRESR